MTDKLKITINEHLAIVKLNRPDKMNALDIDLFEGLINAADELNKNEAIRCVVLAGEGKSFCAGLDLSLFNMGGKDNIMDQPLMPRTHGIANKWQKAVWAWREIDIPVIAAVQGVAFGGGLQLMLGADIKFISPDTKLSIMETKWGIIPDMAGTQLMRHNVREDIIKELTYTHRVFSGTAAVEYGFATHLSDNPLEAAIKLAEEIALVSPSAIVKAKKLINKAPYLNEAEGLLLESRVQDDIIKKHNQIESVFSKMQKRPANFKNYRES